MRYFNKKGQSTVEYILLLGVMITLALTLYRSPYVQQFVDVDSDFINSVQQQIEYSYRNGSNGRNVPYTGSYGNSYVEHPNYIGAEYTRFFGPVAEYP